MCYSKTCLGTPMFYAVFNSTVEDNKNEFDCKCFVDTFLYFKGLEYPIFHWSDNDLSRGVGKLLNKKTHWKSINPIKLIEQCICH